MSAGPEEHLRIANDKISAALAAIESGDPDWQAKVREAQPAMHAFTEAVLEHVMTPPTPPTPPKRRWWQWRSKEAPK